MSWFGWFHRPQTAGEEGVTVREDDSGRSPDQPQGTDDDLQVAFLAEGEQTGQQIAAELAAFIAGARRWLAIAAYDLRLSAPLRAPVEAALRERAAAGVTIRLVYDADKPQQPHLLRGMDPAPTGTGAFVQSLGYPSRAIGGMKLMHQKYVVRDPELPSARVWTGSTNFTDNSWTIEENNILQLASPAIAARYAQDFEELWQDGDIANTGASESLSTTLTYAGAPAHVRLHFAPGCGQTDRRRGRAPRRGGTRTGAHLQHAAQLQRARQRVAGRPARGRGTGRRYL